MSDDYVSVFNSGTGPAVVSAEGHTIGGGEWGVARRLAPEVRRGTEAGTLFVATDPAGIGRSDEANLASETAKYYSERSALLEGAEKSALLDAAGSYIESIRDVAPSVAEAIDGGTDPHKAQLVDALVRSAAPTNSILPAAPSAPQSSDSPAPETPADDAPAEKSSTSRKAR